MATPAPIPQTAPEPGARSPVAPDNLKGVAWILISVVGASAMSVAVRELSATMDARMIVLLRSAIILAALAPVVLGWPRLRGQLRFSRPWMHITRGTLIGISTHFGFSAVAQLPLATVTVLFFTAPIFATLLSAVVHGEKVGPRRWAAVAAGFAGAIIILRPGFQAFEPAMLWALFSSALFAVALSQSRGLSEADGAMSAYVSSVVITVVVSVPAALPVLALPADAWGWFVCAIIVTGGMVRGFADIEAYHYGEAAVLAPITYLRLVLIGAAAFVFYGEVPDGPTLVGAAIIVAATLYIARREALRKRGTAARATSGA